jgi:predicted esterase
MTRGEPLGFRHRAVPVGAQASAAPTLLLLHGTGGNETDLLAVGTELAGAFPGSANLLSPRGKVLENGMPRFFRRIAEGVFDFQDVRFRAGELAAFVDAACRKYGFDPGRVIAAGYSNGANIAAALLLLYPGVLAGGVLFRAMMPVSPEDAAVRSPAPLAVPVPVFIGNGVRDPIAAPEQAEGLAALLRQDGVDVTLHWHSGGHELTRPDIDAARGWLAQQSFPARAE